MPKVYAGSVSLPDELGKFPYDGEQEMLEQEECVDLNGEVHIPKEVFLYGMSVGRRPQRGDRALL